MTVADSASPPRSPAPDAPRVALHAFPSPTTTRFVVILAAMLAVGLFAGDWIHGALHGEQFVGTIESCLTQAGFTPSIQTASEQFAAHDAASECYASARYLQAAYALGGAILVVLIGAGVLFLAPPIIEWRRRLQPVAPTLPAAAGRVDELAHHAGLRYSPTVMRGKTTQRDAFTYGSPGRHKIALPPAVAIRPNQRNLFDPLVFHELAHVCNRDVGLSWLTRGAMYAVVPVLAVPIIMSVATNDFSLIRDSAWRAVILMAAVWTIAIALLRSREHDADLRAANLMHEPNTMIALVSSVRAPARSWWRRLTANHPMPATRADVLTHPHRAATVTFLDGLVPAFLAASAMPLVERVVTSLSTGNPFVEYQGLVAPCIGGILLGCTVGIGLWRAVFVDRAMGVRPSPWIAATGVAAGLVLGQVTSLANSATGLRGGLEQPLWLIIHAVAGLAATALVYSLADVSADAAARLRSSRWVWLPGIVITSLVYFAAWYFSTHLQLVLDIGHWTATRFILAGGVAPSLVLPAAAGASVLTAVAVLFARGSSRAPAWLFDRSSTVGLSWSTAGGTIARPLLVGLVCGACAIIPYAVYRNAAPNDLDETRVRGLLEVTTWSGAAAGAAAALVLIVCVPRRGLALATLAGPVAIGTFMLGFITINIVEANVNNHPSVLMAVTSNIVGLSIVLVAMVAPLALIPRILDSGVGWTAAVSATLAITMCSVAVAVTASASPLKESDLLRGNAAPQVPENVAAAEYLDGPGKLLRDGVILAYTTHGEIPQMLIGMLSGKPSTASERLRSEVIDPLTALKAAVEAVQPQSPKVAAVHADGIELIDSYIVAYGQLADGVSSRDLDQVDQAVEALGDTELFDRWDRGMDELKAIAGRK
jgi:Zn-dependent protease with chaperone function